MADLEALAAALVKGTPEQRGAAIDSIVSLACREHAYDEAHERLRDRWVGPTAERDRALRTRVALAVREVALARGRHRGLRQVIGSTSLTGVPDKQLAWASIVYVFDAASIYDGPTVLDESLALATPEQRGVHAIWWTQSEVCNGGFSQYFSNATAVVWPHLVDGLAMIGASQVADVVARASACFPAGVPREHGERRRQLQDIDHDVLQQIDDAFYALLDGELWPKVGAFIRSHASAFFETE